MYMKHWWNGTDGRTTKVLGAKLFQVPLFFTRNPKHAGLQSNLGLCSDEPATSCLSSGTAKIDICSISELLITIWPISEDSAQLASS
jgi:hypothetical protein